MLSQENAFFRDLTRIGKCRYAIHLADKRPIRSDRGNPTPVHILSQTEPCLLGTHIQVHHNRHNHCLVGRAHGNAGCISH